MAKEKDEPKVVLERVYVVPLRSEFSKVPEYKKTKKAAKALKEFVAKHMKSDNVNIGKELNNFVWKHGIRNPPHHIKITAVKYDSGLVKANLFGVKAEEEKKEESKKPKKAVKEDAKAEQKEEEKTKKDVETQRVSKTFADAKVIEKEEIKELKESIKKEKAPKQAKMPKQVEQFQQAPMSK